MTAADLAAMGATLADGGTNPRTGEQVVSADVARDTLSLLAACGMYERSGKWLFEIGLPALPTILGRVVFGIGQGALVTLVFNILVTAAPEELAGDVGSIRGTAQNLAPAVGTAVMGAVLVTVLSSGISQAVDEHPELPPELVAQVDLDYANFVDNEDLRSLLERLPKYRPGEIPAGDVPVAW